MEDNLIKEEDHAILHLTTRKQWLVKITKDGRLDTHVGYVKYADILGKEYGSQVNSSLGESFWILKPSIYDFIMKSYRKTQVVYPKDAGFIAAKTGISDGSIVAESGTGSGVLTMFLAHLVKPNGHIYSLDTRKEFSDVAKKNIARVGLSNYVTLTNSDAKQGFPIDNANAAIIDVGDPWTLIEPAWNALRGGGVFVSISPTINQVEKVVVKLNEIGFLNTETIEILNRIMEVREGMTRPSMRMIGHTAYLTFATKILKKR